MCYSGALDHIWTFEWLFLIEEFRGAAAAKQELLSLLRRYKCDQADFDITHICCHRARASSRWAMPRPPRKARLPEEDEVEILEEESELIHILEQDMTQLMSMEYEDLKMQWMLLLKADRDRGDELAEDYLRSHPDAASRLPVSALTCAMSAYTTTDLTSNQPIYKIDHRRDRFYVESNDHLIPPFRIHPLSTMGIYALWLEYDYIERDDKQPYHKNQPRELWYQKRIRWFVQLMSILGITANHIEDYIPECRASENDGDSDVPEYYDEAIPDESYEDMLAHFRDSVS